MNENNSVTLATHSSDNITITFKCCRIGNLIIEGTGSDFIIETNETFISGLYNQLLFNTMSSFNFVFGFKCQPDGNYCGFDKEKPLLMFSDLFLPLMNVLMDYTAKRQGLKKRENKNE